MKRVNGLCALLSATGRSLTAPRYLVSACVLAAALAVTTAGVAQTQEADVAVPEIVATHPHDAQAFTQGLLLHQGNFFESTGLRGRSSLREVNVQTGQVLRSKSLESQFFAEGLTLVDDQLIQLTWQRQTAIVYNLRTFEEVKRFSYQGEGWGLCLQESDAAKRLVMSNGSGTLTYRSPDSFAKQGEVAVTLNGAGTTRLNELECVGKLVYANVWQSSNILRIDPASGRVLTRIDASALARAHLRADVINGIAYDAGTQHFFLTGKLWDKVYEVKFDFNPEGAGTATPSARAPAGQTTAAPSTPAPNTAAPAPAASSTAAPNTPALAGGSPNTSAAAPPIASGLPSTASASTSNETGTLTAPGAPSTATENEAPASGLCDCAAVGRKPSLTWWSAAALLALFVRRAQSGPSPAKANTDRPR